MAVGAWVGSLVARAAVGERPVALAGWQDLLGELVRGRLLVVRAARAVTTGQAGLGGGAEPGVLMEQVLRQLDSLIEQAAVHAEREQQL